MSAMMTETPMPQRHEYSHLERLESLASLYLEMNLPEKALAILEKCLLCNPGDRAALAAKDEALRLLKRPA
jgi:hypothetical protein